VHWPPAQGAKDEHIERALQQLHAFAA